MDVQKEKKQAKGLHFWHSASRKEDKMMLQVVKKSQHTMNKRDDSIQNRVSFVCMKFIKKDHLIAWKNSF